MLQSFQRLSQWLAKNASLFIIVIALLTFFLPDLFLWVRGTTQTVILDIIMLTMGLTLATVLAGTFFAAQPLAVLPCHQLRLAQHQRYHSCWSLHAYR